MGILYNLVNSVFLAGEGVTIAGLAINILVNLIPCIRTSIPPSVYATISSMTLLNFLFNILHNPFVSVTLSGVGAIVSFVVSLSASVESYMQAGMYAVYASLIFGNLDWFLVWATTTISSSGLAIATQAVYLIGVIDSIVGIAQVIYILMVLGIIPNTL
jgi:hypothetical protein